MLDVCALFGSLASSPSVCSLARSFLSRLFTMEQRYLGDLAEAVQAAAQVRAYVCLCVFLCMPLCIAVSLALFASSTSTCLVTESLLHYA